MIDLRSDLCSVPTSEMWEAMRSAELGWASVGEDASVNELCGRVAELLGKPAAVWVPTCGMANLVALLTFCQPGDHVVLESASHVLTSEAMGIVEVARLEPAAVWAPDGRMEPDAVEDTIRELRISDRGITLGEPLSEFQGILRGVPNYVGPTAPLLREEDNA